MKKVSSAIIFCLSLILLNSCKHKAPMKMMGVILSHVDSAALKVADSSGIYRPEIWGAKADGVKDCTWALNECSKYLGSLRSSKMGNIYLSTGPYRITSPWYIAPMTIAADSCFVTKRVDLAPANFSNYLESRRYNVISVIGTGFSAIYADFNDTTKLQPAIFYGVQGDTRARYSIELYAAKITGVGVYAQGYFDKVGLPTKAATSAYNSNRVVGLLMYYNTMVQLDGLTFTGFKEGIIYNNSYFSDTKNVNFRACKRAMFMYQSHASVVENVVASDCQKAFEVRSSQVNFTNVYTTACPISLHVGGGSNNFKAVYLESNNCGEAQIIVGDNPSDPYYVPGYTGYVDGTSFEALTVVANKLGGGAGTAISFKESARRVSVIGGSLQSSNQSFANASNELIIQGVLGTFSSQTYKRDADATFKSVYVLPLKAPTGTVKQLYINDKGLLVTQ